MLAHFLQYSSSVRQQCISVLLQSAPDSFIILQNPVKGTPATGEWSAGLARSQLITSDCARGKSASEINVLPQLQLFGIETGNGWVPLLNLNGSQQDDSDRRIRFTNLVKMGFSCKANGNTVLHSYQQHYFV